MTPLLLLLCMLRVAQRRLKERYPPLNECSVCIGSMLILRVDKAKLILLGCQLGVGRIGASNVVHDLILPYLRFLSQNRLVY